MRAKIKQEINNDAHILMPLFLLVLLLLMLMLMLQLLTLCYCHHSCSSS